MLHHPLTDFLTARGLANISIVTGPLTLSTLHIKAACLLESHPRSQAVTLSRQEEKEEVVLSDLHEGEDEADGEVGQPVEAAGHRVCRWSV